MDDDESATAPTYTSTRIGRTIRINMARCRKCGDLIESKHRHDFVRCKCGAIAVDGGRDYLRRVGDYANFEELSEYDPADGEK
jgi:hypothetical protein